MSCGKEISVRLKATCEDRIASMIKFNAATEKLRKLEAAMKRNQRTYLEGHFVSSCPGCGAPPKPGAEACEYCGRGQYQDDDQVELELAARLTR